MHKKISLSGWIGRSHISKPSIQIKIKDSQDWFWQYYGSICQLTLQLLRCTYFLYFYYKMLDPESLCLPKRFRLTAFFNHKIKPDKLVAVNIKPDISEARVNCNYQLLCDFLFNQFIFSGIIDFWPFRITNILFTKDSFLLQLCCIQWQHQDVRPLFTWLCYSPSNFLCLVNQNNLQERTRMPGQQDAEWDTEIEF